MGEGRRAGYLSRTVLSVCLQAGSGYNEVLFLSTLPALEEHDGQHSCLGLWSRTTAGEPGIVLAMVE